MGAVGGSLTSEKVCIRLEEHVFPSVGIAFTSILITQTMRGSSAIAWSSVQC